MISRQLEDIIKITLLLSVFLSIIFFSSCEKKEKVYPDDPPLPILHWKAGDDILITEDLYIDSVNFIVDPGVTVKIQNGCNIIIGENYPAKITVVGTATSPINFIAYNPEGIPNKSYWGSIILKSIFEENTTPTLEYCNFIKGGGEGSEAVIVNYSISINIKNCLIDYSLNYGILSGRSAKFNQFTNNTIKHTLNHPITISASYAHTIGVNNTIITDSLNKGVLITYSGISVGLDTLLWHAQTVPYIIPSGLSVSGSSQILSYFMLEEGTTIMLGKNANINFGKDIRFIANGLIDKPITFTSLELEPQSGDWRSISFGYKTTAKLKHCIFEYGGNFEQSMVDNAMVRLYSATDISMENCVFSYSEGPAILLYKYATNLPMPAFASFTNNIFSNLDGCAISLEAECVNSIGDYNNFNNHYIYIQSSTIKNKHIIWKNFGTAYLLESFVSINGEYKTILEIESGVTIKLDRGSGFKVGTASQWGGTLIAVGTEEKPIIFTSIKEYPYYGGWSGIVFYTNTREGTILDHCQILYAGEYSLNFKEASIHICCNDDNVSIMNSTVAHSSHYGLVVSSSANPYLHNNTFYDNLEGGK